MKYFEKVMFRISLLNLDTVDQTEILHENVLFSGKMKARYFLGLLVLISECLYLCEANGVYLHSPHGSCNRGIEDLKDVKNQSRLFTSNVSKCSRFSSVLKLCVYECVGDVYTIRHRE